MRQRISRMVDPCRSERKAPTRTDIMTGPPIRPRMPPMRMPINMPMRLCSGVIPMESDMNLGSRIRRSSCSPRVRNSSCSPAAGLPRRNCRALMMK